MFSFFWHPLTRNSACTDLYLYYPEHEPLCTCTKVYLHLPIQEGLTPLALACKEGSTDIVYQLVAAGAFVNLLVSTERRFFMNSFSWSSLFPPYPPLF